jgi:hypothetical protein
MTEFHLAGIGKVKNNGPGAGVAPVTASCHTESDVSIVTGPAGTVLLHVPHVIPLASFPSDEYPAMAIHAYIHLLDRVGMYLVAERGRNPFKNHVRAPLVAPVAVTPDGKSIFTIMASAA